MLKTTEEYDFPSLDKLCHFLRPRVNLLKTIEQRSNEINNGDRSKPKVQRHTILLSYQVVCNFGRRHILSMTVAIS